MLFTALLVSRPNCSGCGWTSPLLLLLDHPLVVGRESVVCRGRVLVLCSSAFLGTARRVVGSGNIWTDCYRWAGRWLLLVTAGCWSPNHSSLQTTHPVSGLETGDCPHTGETVYSLLRL